MATVSGKDAALNELLACAVCLNRYTDPRTLPCHHSFCKDCIDGLQLAAATNVKYSLYCPTCRNPFQLRGGHGACSLPVAIDINNLLEITLKKDEIETRSSNGEPGFQVCQIHGRPKDMYCDTCEEYVCLKCSLKYHHRHQCDRAEFLFTQHKQQIEASLEPMKNKIDELEQTLTQFDTREKELKAQENTVQEEIIKANQLLMNQLQESQRKLSQELSTAMQAKLQRHSMERAKAETALVQMRSCCDFVSKELKTRTDYQIQAAKVELIKRIDGTHSVVRVSRLQPTQPDTVFTADRNTISACERIGRISDKATKPFANILPRPYQLVNALVGSVTKQPSLLLIFYPDHKKHDSSHSDKCKSKHSLDTALLLHP